MKLLDLNNNSANENIKRPTPKSNIFQAFGFCINGINSVKYFIAMSFTENEKPANNAQKILNFTL